MKRLHLATIIVATVLFSCRNNNTETTTTDSLADSANSSSDTTASPTEEEIIAAEADMDSEGNQDDLRGDDFDYTYEGLVNNKIKVKVNLFQIKGELKARLVYLSSKKIINMDALYPAVGTFELTEKINDKTTGVWKIAAEEEDILAGMWYSPDGIKQLPVQLAMTDGDFDDFLPTEEIKTGFYELKQPNEDTETKAEFPFLSSEELHVKNMTENTIYFDLYIQGSPPGVHVGMINGMAGKSANSYVYKNEEGCEITMSFSGSEVTLNQNGTDINCGFGANISAFGTLKKKEN